LEIQVGTLGLILQPFDFGQKLQNRSMAGMSTGSILRGERPQVQLLNVEEPEPGKFVRTDLLKH
jgi:hypothetical protein